MYGGATNKGGTIELSGGNNTGATGSGIVFKTGASTSSPPERMRIDNEGRVGIANDTPGDFNASGDDLVIGNSSGNRGITIRSGTSNSGNLFFADGLSGDQLYRGFIQYQHADDRLVLGAGGDDRVWISSSGNVGIGTASPDNPLEVVGADSGIKISAGSSNRPMLRFECGSDEKLTLSANTAYGAIGDGSDANRYIILKDGNVGIKNTDPQRLLHVSMGGSNVAGDGFDSAIFQNNDAVAIRLVDAGDAGSNGGNAGLGNDNGNLNVACAGAMTFATGLTANMSLYQGSSTGGTERMRIHVSGGISFGTGNDFGSVTSFCTQSGKVASVYRDIEGNGNYIIFQNSSNTAVGSITRSSSSTVYATSSDYRLKENVDYSWDATTRLKQLKPARFNFIADDTNTLVDGFLAHEVSSVVPEAITGTKDAVDGDGNPDYQGIDQSKLVPLLVKTIQELEARITALEA